MLEGEVYAIETFASTGQGMVVENGECSHFALVPEQYAMLRTQKAKALLELNVGDARGVRRRIA